MAGTLQPSHLSQQSEFRIHERHTQKSMCDTVFSSVSLLSICVVILICVWVSYLVHPPTEPFPFIFVARYTVS